MKLEFIGSSARDQTNAKGNPSRLVNGYREPMLPGGKSQHVLRSVLGMEPFASVSKVFARDLSVFGSAIIFACGGDLFSISAGGGVSTIGAIGDSEMTTMAENSGILTIAANGVYRTSDGLTVSGPIATGAIGPVSSVAHLGGYTVVSEVGGRTIQWSILGDPATFNGIDFATAEITPDPVVRLITFKEALFIFKEAGFERWAVTGQAGPNAFARIDGAMMEPGLAGFNLITTFPNGFAFVASDGKVYAFVGGQLSPISTPPVEVALTENNASRMFFYERRGHGFICVVFSDAMAWCYDMATGEWHERGEGEGPWTAKTSVKLNGDWFVGTDAGRVAKLSALCSDFGNPLVRRFVSRTLREGPRFNVDMIEAFPRVGLDKQTAADPSNAGVALRTSRDGFTWSAAKVRDVGVTGAYATRLTWRALGQFREATIELSLSSEADIPLLAEIEVMAS